MPVTDSKPSSDKLQTQDPQIIQYAAPYPQQFEDDTIDLYELWITLWNKKWLVIAVTVIAALGSVAYTLLAPQIYKAEAMLLPPRAIDFQSLNMQGVTTEKAFSAFKINLSSRILQKKFINEQGLMDILVPDRSPETRDIEILENFSKMIKNEDKGGFLISMEFNDPVFAAKLVNDYVGFFNLETVRSLASDARNTIGEQIMDIEAKIASKREIAKLRKSDQITAIENSISAKREGAKQRRSDQITAIENTISAKRELAKQRRSDQITAIKNTISAKREGAKQKKGDEILRFKEAIVIADSLGIRKREDATSFIKSAQMNLDIITATTPLYYAGTISLEAEISILEKRKSDDPFISGLRDLQENLAQLNSIKYDDPTIAGLRDLQEQLTLLNSIKSDDPTISGLRDLQENLGRLNSIKSDDFFIPSGENKKGIRDLQEELTLLNSIKSDDPTISGLRDLQEELALLNSIKYDDTFISGLRDMQEELALLGSVKIEEEGQNVVTVDQAAYPPKNRIKPNRRLIVSLGTVVGLFLGIFLVFVVSFVQKQKETHSESYLT